MRLLKICVFLLSISVIIKVEAAAIFICFSHEELIFTEQQKEVNKKRLTDAIKKGDDASAIYYMTSELAYIKGNPYKKGTKNHVLKQDAIFWDAVFGNKLDIVRQFVELEIELDKLHPIDFKLSPLMIASRCGYKEMVAFLLQAGVEVNMEGSIIKTGNKYSKGITALSQAKLMEHDEIEDMLIEAGARTK